MSGVTCQPTRHVAHSAAPTQVRNQRSPNGYLFVTLRFESTPPASLQTSEAPSQHSLWKRGSV